LRLLFRIGQPQGDQVYARPVLEALLAERRTRTLRLRQLPLVAEQHLRTVLALVLGHGDLAGQFQAGAGDAVLRRDLDRAAPRQQVVGDALALVAVLEAAEVQRRVGQRAVAVNVVCQVVHDLALLAAQLHRLGQRRAAQARRLRQVLRVRR